jgi:hypothetical protein
MSTRFTPAHKDLGDLLDGFKLYRDGNPNAPYQQEFTFYTKMHCGNQLGERNPGPAWHVTGDPIIAASDGYVTKKGHNTAGHAGDWVNVKPSFSSPFTIHYTHIGSIQVDIMDEVERGKTILGYGIGYFKLMLFDLSNCIDPEYFGVNHGYMNFWDGVSNYSVYDAHLSKMEQRKVITEFVNLYLGEMKKEVDTISNFKNLLHRRPYKVGSHTVWNFRWTEGERFRLLEHLYKNNSDQFDLGQSDFQDLKQTLYANQPLVLTLPFKKDA